LLLAANALLAILEYVIDRRFFPYRFDGAALEWDKRSAGLLGHALGNALITGTYLIILVSGGGPGLPRLLRLPAIVLQLAALVPLGGRTALLTAVAMIGGRAVWGVFSVLGGRRISLLAAAAGLLMVPVAAFALGIIVTGGFFDLIVERFNDDG